MRERGESAARVVMVVEDFDDFRALLKLLLESKGYHVLEASNGLEAIELAKVDPPELILMDLSMPELDGLEATRRIREDERHANTPIVAVTAQCEPEWRGRAAAAGMTDCVAKPVGIDKLNRILEEYLPAA